MGQTEIIIFLVLANIAFLILITGIFVFVFKYRKRKIEYNKEIHLQQEQHRFDLLNTQVNVQQETMQYIGREIHDSVAQKLTLASIYSGHMHNKAPWPELVKPLENITKIINDSLTELRQLSHNLTNDRQQRATLSELIQAECDNVNATGACTAILNASALPELNIATKNSLLRVVQEFLQNSLKYAACTQIKIELGADETGLTLLMTDNGNGFNLEDNKHKGIGLDNMKRRVLAIGGQFLLNSVEGQGTTLRANLPDVTLITV